jgi:hypothetical protein
MNFCLILGSGQYVFTLFKIAAFPVKDWRIFEVSHRTVNERFIISKKQSPILMKQSPMFFEQSRTLFKRSPMFGLTKFDFPNPGPP